MPVPKIFPYLFVRYGGLEKQSLQALTFDAIETYYLSFVAKEANAGVAREQLCLQLYSLIKTANDPLQQKLLLNLKRNVFNDRPSVAKDIHRLSPALKHLLNKDLAYYLTAIDNLNSFLKNFDLELGEVLRKQRRLLQTFSRNEQVLKGILLSSTVFFKELGAFAKANPGKFSRNELRNEFSLLRYLTRMACKTSPFSTFTYIGLAIESERDCGEAITTAAPVASRVRINNKVLKELKSIMAQHPVLNETLYVQLNSTTTLQGNKFSFLINYLNLEVFQQVPASEINKLIFEILTSQQHPITLMKFVSMLQQAIDGEAVEIKAYVMQLVAAGLIELDANASELDPHWDISLMKFLEAGIPSAGSILVIDLLKKMQHAKTKFEQGAIDARAHVLADISHQLNTTLSWLRTQAGIMNTPIAAADDLANAVVSTYNQSGVFTKLSYAPANFKQERIFYEDCFIAHTAGLPKSELNVFIKKLEGLCGALSDTDTFGQERHAMKAFFKRNFSDEQVVPLLDFYKAYAFYKNSLVAGVSAEHDPFVQQWVAAIEQAMYSKDLLGDVIELSAADMGGVAKEKVAARAAFIQFYHAGSGNLHGVVNRLMWGMGKLNGRFLHLFNDAITQQQHTTNLNLFPGIIQMELNDGSSFNANLHPPLLDYEIRMPGSHPRLPSNQQILVTQLAIKYNRAENKLQLWHTGFEKEVYAYDLCLESFYNRSNLYKLLAHFNPMPQVSIQRFIKIIDRCRERAAPIGSAPIKFKPAIVYERNVVLRRRGWLIQRSHIPVQQPVEAFGSYWLRLIHWLKENQLPCQVFIFLRSTLFSENSDKTAGKRDDYKPQYVNFRQPLAVILFLKLLQRAGENLYFEEALPAPDQMADTDRVQEHLIQWYNTSQ